MTTNTSTNDAPSIKPLIEELERAFAFFASALWFKPRRILLPLPVITLQSSKRDDSGTLGWFSHDEWQCRDKDERMSEINICGEHLQDDLYEIIDTLLHEMCHYANALKGIRDCSSNQYHNRHFRRECESIGLLCKRAKNRGWSKTELTPELRQLIDESGISDEPFRIFRGEHQPLEEEETEPHTPKTRKQKLAKWSCSCPVNVRVAWGTSFDATCNCCHASFERQLS